MTLKDRVAMAAQTEHNARAIARKAKAPIAFVTNYLRRQGYILSNRPEIWSKSS